MRLVSVAVALALAVALVPSAYAQNPVKLVLWGGVSGQAETDAVNQVIANFNKVDPNVQAQFVVQSDMTTNLNKALAAGTPPDVFYVDSNDLANEIQSGALVPIGDKIDNVSDFYPSLVQAFTVNGKFYCPPKDFSTLALQINTDMMAAAGIKNPPTTWDELAADAKAMTTKDVAGFVENTDVARWLAWLYAAGGSVTDDNFTKMTINSPEGTAALKAWTDLFVGGNAKKSADVGAGWPGDAFEKGKAAMTAEGNWILGDAKKNAPNLKYVSAPLPAGPKGQATMAFTVCYGVAAAGKNIDAATKLANFLVNPDSMKVVTETLGVMPSRQSLATEWLAKFPEQKVYLDGAKYAHRWGFVPGFNAVNDDINKQIDLVEAGSETVADALAEIEKTGNDVLSKFNASKGGAGASATMAATQ
ncbi:MAG TPA: ABC transporter substrate-binding protein [Aggregatilineales bacterium]|nr:ABC transporter substrate-binding protein [Aggregatilineales bacterium]